MRGARALLLLCLAACAITETVHDKDGKRFGVVTGAFRGRWYNYYERGQSYLAGGYYAEAIEDFRAALALRDRDQRRARTYGLHFIDYFPWRELGIALFHQGDLDGAVEALQTSLGHVDSGRAEFYANTVRREQLRARGVRDTTPPVIEISAPLAGLHREVSALRATIRDPSLVARVEVDGAALLLPLARDAVTLDEPLTLGPGEHTVTVVAYDLFDNRAEARLELKLDREPPLIALADVEDLRGQLTLRGKVEDGSGVAVLRANGKVAASDGAGAFALPVDEGPLVLEAEDRAGNQARVEVDLARLRQALAARDQDPPAITVAPVPEVVFLERIFIDGAVTDRGAVARLAIGAATLESGGHRTVYFRQDVELARGANQIVISASDDAGRTSRQVIAVTRKDPEARALDARLSIAMAPFAATGEEDEGRAGVEESLESALVDRRRFHLKDRARVQSLATEWQLVATNLAEDGADLLRLGEALKADTTMLGFVAESDDSIEVYARLVDTETGAILLEKDVFHEKKSLRNVRELCRGLALKLEAALPMVSGTLEAVGSDGLDIAMADALLLPVGARLLVVDAANGTERFGADEVIVGEARVQATRPGTVRAVLLVGKPAARATVITK